MFKIFLLVAFVALAKCGDEYGETTAAPAQTTAAPVQTTAQQSAAPQTTGAPAQTTAQQGYGQTTAQPSNGQTGQPGTQATSAPGNSSGSGSGSGQGGPCRLPSGQIVQSASYPAPPSNNAVQKTSGQGGTVSGNQVNVIPVGVNDNNIAPILNGNQIAIPLCVDNVLNGDSILNPDIGSIGVVAPISALGNNILSGLLRRRRDASQSTSGQSGTASGNQVNVAPVGVNGNNILPVANGNQIAAPIDLNNIANGDSILNPAVGPISVLAPVGVIGNDILTPVLRRRRDSGSQITSGLDGTLSGIQANVLPVGVNGNNIAPVLNGNQIAVPVGLSNIANGDSILNPTIDSISAAVPVSVLGNSIASNLLGGSGLPLKK